jgi:hypothetical protein
VAAAAFSISIFGFLTAADAQTDGQFRGQTATVYIAILSAAATILRSVAFASPRPSFVLRSYRGHFQHDGGQSITCVNFLYNVAPRGGTAIGILNQIITGSKSSPPKAHDLTQGNSEGSA